MAFGDPKVMSFGLWKRTARLGQASPCQIYSTSSTNKVENRHPVFIPGLGVGKSGTANGLHCSKLCHFKSPVHGIPLLCFESSGVRWRGWG